jgi:UDP-glucose 4-epimerase
MKLLVTGGSGYIGTHTVVELLNDGHQVIVLDNLSNSNLDALEKVGVITNTKLQDSKASNGDYFFFEGDLRDRNLINKIFSMHSFDAVIHFAGLKSVSESVNHPLEYYSNNVIGSIVLFEEMQKADVKTIIFSSTAAVYGIPSSSPITENFSTENILSPYGKSKLMIENILKDIHASDPNWKIALLRYFNPAGAHPSGIIGENPNGVPNNLIPHISQVASGKLYKLKIFGNDYPTIDGTGVRDYIHVVDLAKGHISALNFINRKNSILDVFNLGTGKGTSVLEMVKAFEKASGQKISYEFEDRRPGDVAECWTSTKYAESVLGWKAQLSIKKMCEDTWLWQKRLS